MALSPFEQGITSLNIAAAAALVIRLAWTGLFRTYPFLFLYMIVDIVETGAGLWIQNNKKRYGEVYMAGQAVKMILVVFVILRLYRLALAGHPALARFGRRAVSYVLAGAAVVAAGGLIIHPAIPPRRSPIMFRFLSFEQTMDAWMLIFLILLSLFTVWFPVRLKRNVTVYIVGFMIYFLSRTSGLLLTNVMPERFTHPIAVVMLCVSFLCLTAWAVGLSPAGEHSTAMVGHRWNPRAIAGLTRQLDSINASLERLVERNHTR